MHTIFNVLGYFSLGMALLGLGSTLFGSAGLWGFLVFLLGMYLAGAEYSMIFLRWATRVAVVKLLDRYSG